MSVKVKLGQYKGIVVTMPDMIVDEQEVDAALELLCQQYVEMETLTEGVARMGDTVTIDFEGFMDGVTFEGGKGENYPLLLGSESFIEGFEDQIVDHPLEEGFEVNVSFPEDYPAEELAGKPAMFRVCIHQIDRPHVPEMNEELVKKVGLDGVETVEDLRETQRKELENKKVSMARNDAIESALKQVVENAEIEVPEEMINEQVQQMAKEFMGQLEQQGMKLDQYLHWTGLKVKDLLAQYRPTAEIRVKIQSVMDEIAKEEGLTVTEEEIEEEIRQMAAHYQMQIEQVKEMVKGNEASIAADILKGKAYNVVIDNLIIQ